MNVESGIIPLRNIEEKSSEDDDFFSGEDSNENEEWLLLCIYIQYIIKYLSIICTN